MARIYSENTSKIGCKNAKTENCKKIDLELSENSAKIDRESIKPVQKSGRKFHLNSLNKMNTKPSKITLKKQVLPRRNFSTQTLARISRELSLSRLLYVDLPKNSREILLEFFRNAEINL